MIGCDTAADDSFWIVAISYDRDQGSQDGNGEFQNMEVNDFITWHARPPRSPITTTCVAAIQVKEKDGAGVILIRLDLMIGEVENGL